MTLMLHVNATEVAYDGLRQLETPPATQSHVPIPHFRVVDLVKSTVGMFGHEVVGEHTASLRMERGTSAFCRFAAPTRATRIRSA